jgi:hypothetical protein
MGKKIPTPRAVPQYDLKVLSSEMDTAEIRLIRKVVIKERGAAFFKKNPPAPHLLRAL